MSTSNDSWPTRDVLRCAHLNINHAINKLTDTASVSFNSGKKYNIRGLSESRLSTHISNSDISIPGYSSVLMDPKQHKETGLVIYIHDSWSSHVKVLSRKFISYLKHFLSLDATKIIL